MIFETLIRVQHYSKMFIFKDDMELLPLAIHHSSTRPAPVHSKGEAILCDRPKDQRELVCDNHTQKSHKSSQRWSSCTVTFTFTKPGRTEYLRDIACFVVGQSNSQLDNL